MHSDNSASAADLIYAGWVPTVNGRLSFRHVGESAHPTESVYANITIQKTPPQARFVLAFQKRPLGDALFRPLSDLLLGYSADFWFVLIAESLDDPASADELSGKIYIYKSRTDWKKAEATVVETIDRLNELRFSLEASRDSETRQLYSRIGNALAGTADMATRFALLRQGEVYFSRPQFLDPELERDSINYAESLDQDFPKWVADQSYFFLRDLCHHHQHHAHTEDTILILQDRDEDDVAWRQRIIYSLYFYIIRAKRTGQFRYLVRALGVQAYCKSFKRISAPRFRSTNFDMPHFNDSTLSQSIRARIDEENWENQRNETLAIKRATTSANWRMLVLTIVLVVLAVIAIFAPEALRQPPLSNFSKAIAPLVLPTLELLGLLIVFVFVATSKVVLEWKDVLEVSNVHRRITMVLVLLIAVAILLWVVVSAWDPISSITIAVAKLFR